MLWEHTVLIQAPVELVWQLTVDIARWPSFVPTVRSVRRLDSGPLRVGSAARLKQPGQPAAVWTVTSLEPMDRFAWQTRRPGLTMTGTHLLSAVDGGCRNTLTVEATGPASRVFGPLFGRQIRRAIARENGAFQRVARDLANNG